MRVFQNQILKYFLKIIKLNTLDGSRDVYFGPKNMTIHNIKN